MLNLNMAMKIWISRIFERSWKKNCPVVYNWHLYDQGYTVEQINIAHINFFSWQMNNKKENLVSVIQLSFYL